MNIILVPYLSLHLCFPFPTSLHDMAPSYNPSANLTALHICELISRYHSGDFSRHTLRWILQDCTDEKKDTVILTWLIRAGVGGGEEIRNMREQLKGMSAEEKVAWLLRD
jgi:hypothetical protein